MKASVHRKIKRGKIKGIWNQTWERMDYYLRSKRGGWILCNPFAGTFILQGPGLAGAQLDKMQKQ
jgi:hypothetical protein